MKRIIIFLFILICNYANAQLHFKTGANGFNDFVRKNIIYPAFSKYNCIDGLVEVSFKLDTGGRVFDVLLLKGVGTDLDDEAQRLVKLSSGYWNVPKNFNPDTEVIIPVNFVLDGYNCHLVSAEIKNQAKQAYLLEKESLNIITNYYQKANQDIYPEEYINQLKNSLGIDENYLKEKIEIGLKKIAQKDFEGACLDFNFVKNMGSEIANNHIIKYCK